MTYLLQHLWLGGNEAQYHASIKVRVCPRFG
jgi:hypothetical protein